MERDRHWRPEPMEGPKPPGYWAPPWAAEELEEKNRAQGRTGRLNETWDPPEPTEEEIREVEEFIVQYRRERGHDD